jgi:hypothetical protein
MKTHALWFVAIVAAALCGCADEPLITYDQPLTSPGGEFSKLPPAVQNSVRAEAGMAEIERVIRNPNGPTAVYEIRFRNEAAYPPLYLASDGSVLTSNLTVAVGASVDAIEVSTGSEASGVKMDDLPSNVILTIRHAAPTAEVDSIGRVNSGKQVFYSVAFKNPTHHPSLLIRDDGHLMQ